MRRTLVASIGAIALSTAAVTGVMAGSREASTWEGSTLEAFILEAFVREGSTPAAFIREPFTRAVCVREDWQQVIPQAQSMPGLPGCQQGGSDCTMRAFPTDSAELTSLVRRWGPAGTAVGLVRIMGGIEDWQDTVMLGTATGILTATLGAWVQV